MFFTANDSIGTSGQFLELKRLSDALSRLQQRLAEKTSSLDIRKTKDLVSDSCPVGTSLMSCQGVQESEMERMKSTEEIFKNEFYEERSRGGVEEDRDKKTENKGREEEEEERVDGFDEEVEEGEEEGNDENPRLSEAHREYPGFTLTGPDTYTSAKDHCLQVRTYVMLCYVMLCYVMLYYVMLCYIMLCYVTLCYVMSCHVMSCHVMSCHVMSLLYFVSSYLTLSYSR